MISRVPPPRAKRKGRKMTGFEKKEVTLGARGEKKGTRRCSVCGMYTTHNARTCLQLKHNRERLEAMHNSRQRGRPPGAKNKSRAMHRDGVEQEHTTRPATRGKVTPMNGDSECESDSESADGMDYDE